MVTTRSVFTAFKLCVTVELFLSFFLFVHVGVFHTEWKDRRKARSTNTEGWVLPDRRHVE